MAALFKPQATEQEENHWLSVSDLMAGLMVVFLFIAIALMRDALRTAGDIQEIAVAYQETQVDIYESLMDEFSDDLDTWDAEIDEETLTFTFNSPDVLFDTGEIALSGTYKDLLTDFFPRYMAVLDQFRNSINEVRLEGHTSSRWNSSVTDSEAYFLNMQLSQGRTRSVLNFIYSLDQVAPYRDWIKSHIAAVGYSSARPILDSVGGEDPDKSRRVSFRVISNADIRIKQILEIDQ